LDELILINMFAIVRTPNVLDLRKATRSTLYTTADASAFEVTLFSPKKEFVFLTHHRPGQRFQHLFNVISVSCDRLAVVYFIYPEMDGMNLEDGVLVIDSNRSKLVISIIFPT
jgi:hypothetical protein